jgi:hypothetical protein
MLGTSNETVYIPNEIKITNKLTVGTTSLNTTEFGYLSGLTSNIQTQINNKPNLSSTIVSYLNGITSDVQTQINNKPNLSSDNSWSGNQTFTKLYIGNQNNSIEEAESSVVSGPIITGFAGAAIAYNNGSTKNIIATFKAIGLTILNGSLILGTSILTNTVLGYLQNITSDVQSQLNSINTPKSGQILQTRYFNSTNAQLDNTSVTSNGTTNIFSTTITALSTSSMFHITFDPVQWGISGSGQDTFDSRILFLRNDINYTAPLPTVCVKSARFGYAQRDTPIVLFPISGVASSSGKFTYTAYIDVIRSNSDDTLSISNPDWCMTITEVQN